ncbi:MAG: bi-domain-containing oxidoreductase [Thermoplasmatota archaeon]
MKQVLLYLKSGEIKVEDVPVPALKPGGVVVSSRYSVISGGTELSTINLAKASYLGKAKMKPDLFNKMVNLAKKQGPLTAYQAAMGRLNKPEPLGYSCAGVVSKVSDGVPFKVGDRVACGGAGYASHADFVFTPKNLCVKIPDNVSFRDASFTTIGAIAMQGVRNGDLRLGERVAVIGMGLIGQITAQILKASGCRVFGIDIDKKKLDLAKGKAIEDGALADAENIDSQANAFTRGNGFDAVIITAATKSKDPLNLAGRITRQKGKVVLVGVVGMEIPRDIYYQKELQFIVSCSYGPGRYDPEYEEMGRDYPFGYVRWTENRNMEAFLELLSRGDIRLDDLVTHEFEIEKAVQAYDLIKGEIKEPYLGVVIKYGEDKVQETKVSTKKKPDVPKKEGQINIGWVGAGSFATTTLLPTLKKIDNIRLVGMCAATGISSKSASATYGFEYGTTEYTDLLNDDDIDAVIVTTRNSLHAEIANKALEAGKHVFVEKPLAITNKELNKLIRNHEKHPDRIVQVGFNRRFAPITKKILSFMGERKGPMMVHYRVNAGALPKNHWVYEDREGGSRFITELCHFIDYCRFVVGSEITDYHYFNVDHPALHDKESTENLVLNMKYHDGSVASIVYNTIGDSDSSKEYAELYCDGTTVRMTDFRELEVIRKGKVRRFKDHLRTEKGHREEIVDFIQNIRNGINPFDEYINTTKITLGRKL